MTEPSNGLATCAAPITRGWTPNAFEKRTRIRFPPALVCTTCRSVWSWKTGASVGPLVMLAPHVPTQLAGPRSDGVPAIADDPESQTRKINPIHWPVGV